MPVPGSVSVVDVPDSGGLDRQDVGSWLSGPREAAQAHGHEVGYRGQRLGLPESGPGSVAGFGRRLAALFVDWFASIAVTGLIGGPLSGGALVYGTPDYSLVVLAVFAVETALLVGLTGASFGHRLLGLRVASLVDRPVGLGRATARTALLCLAVPALVWDRDGRGLHDRAVATVVVRS